MLGYNDAYHHGQQQSDASCVVCHDLVPSGMIIWHHVKTARYTDSQVLVPICVDCADLFHDVKPAR